ncbi:MAG: hypothetical protein GF416_02450 [Candidatus Altiarchaeales archaeon]|nr:hypothetical protein [Candidatus Altiarchaeales archaeon]MBD3415980.1 hypothetical protein [Candidatus Altiarchaeales archaeon]
MSRPPAERPPGEGAPLERAPKAWEYPGLDARLLKFVKREGQVGFRRRAHDIDDSGYVEIGGLKYMVLENINSPRFSFTVPMGLNALFDRSCKAMGVVGAGGSVCFAGPVDVKNLESAGITFDGGISSWGSVHAREGEIKGRGDIIAEQVKARSNIGVYGSVSAQLVMSLDGFLSADSVRGEAILGSRGVLAMNGSLEYPNEANTDVRRICLVWSRDGRIYSKGGIRTGSICSSQDILTSEGDLQIEKDAFCISANIKGRVVNSKGEDASTNLYSRRGGQILDEYDRKVMVPARDVDPDDLYRKVERSPFAWDRWEQYYTRYTD